MVAYVVWLGDNSSQAAGAVEGFFGQDVEVAGAEDEDAAGEVMVGARQAGVQDGREGVGGSPPVPPVREVVGQLAMPALGSAWCRPTTMPVLSLK